MLYSAHRYAQYGVRGTDRKYILLGYLVRETDDIDILDIVRLTFVREVPGGLIDSIWRKSPPKVPTLQPMKYPC